MSTSTLKNKRSALLWQIIVMIVFPLMIVLGLLMRLNQGGVITHQSFYAYMTLHGMGMVGILFTGAFAALWYLLSKELTLSRLVNNIVLFLVVLGFILFAYATLVQNFAAGWYVLYPLPFIGKGAWEDSATGLTIISLLIMGVGWLIGMLALLVSLSKKYGFTNLMGWQYFKTDNPEVKTRPIHLITVIMVVNGILAIIGAAWLLIIYLAQHFEPTLTFDALLTKNLSFFFGHTMANITLYMGLAWIYEILPRFTGRPWGMDKAVTIAWNATMFFILFAFLHHMYMDFVQPKALQYIGQVASYMSAVPSTVVTIIGLVAQLYKSKASTKWRVTPALFFIGCVGWSIGGVAAILDSTIALNRVFHGTLWVPAHFHTYYLIGFVPMFLGFLYYLFNNESNPKKDMFTKWSLIIFFISAVGFLVMFYLGGLYGVPRRFSNYMMFDRLNVGEVGTLGVLFAKIAAMFVYGVLLAVLLFFVGLFRSFGKTWKKIEIEEEVAPL